MTKKILALVFAAVLLLTAFSSFAENYSNYSLEELENLQRMIEEEMQKRKDADTNEAQAQPEGEAPADDSQSAFDQFLNDLGIDTSLEYTPENAQEALGDLLGLLFDDSQEAEDTKAPAAEEEKKEAAEEETAVKNDLLEPIRVLSYGSGVLMSYGYMPDMETMLALITYDRNALETEDGKLCFTADPFVVSAFGEMNSYRMTKLSVGATRMDEKISADMANIAAHFLADILTIEGEQALEIVASLTDASQLSPSGASRTIKGCQVSVQMNPAPDMACLFVLSIPDINTQKNTEAEAAQEPAIPEEPVVEPAEEPAEEPEEPAVETKVPAMDSEPMDRSDKASYVDEGIYQNGIAYEKKGKYERALVIFRHIPEYRNTQEHIEFCENALNNGK